ncbi:MAG TPA: HAMP domain-containing sensor histidine kinase [Gaiellaceae bacterium]|nr:HAMP domain-containing sensor histidine kinase [Gaiellaceae bacterium]
MSENPIARAIGRAPVTVRTKLLVGFVGIAALLVLVGILGLLALGRSNARVARLGTLQAHAAAYQGLQTDVTQLKNLLLERRSFTPNAGVPLGRAAKAPPSSAFQVLDSTINTALTTLITDATVLEDAEPALFAQVYAIYTRLSAQTRAALAQDQSGTGAAEGPLVLREIALTNELAPMIEGLATRTKAQKDALVAQNQQSFTSSRNLFIEVAAGSVFFALLLGFALSWSLIGPLRRTEARLAEIASGDFSRHVEVPNRDEIGVLAANVNRMNDELGRLYAELETVSRHKSDFLATMSHELRTPLDAIIGFSEVLREQMFGELNEQQLAYVDDVLEAGRHLLSLINDVLDLAKIEAGHMELDFAEVSIPEVLRSGVTMHGERASRGGIALGLNVESEEITAEADERRVRQVVFNLLSNAIKFTPPDGRVDVSARLIDGVVEIAVTDTGAGIAPEELDLIFEEFEQGQRTNRAGRTEGTGLGLPLSRKFVELHGGRLWAESTLGAGSTFRFTLPIERDA